MNGRIRDFLEKAGIGIQIPVGRQLNNSGLI